MSRAIQRGADPRHVQRVNNLVNRLIMLAEEDLQLAEVMARAPLAKEGAESLTGQPLPAPSLSMTDAQLAARGWTRVDLSVALDALKNKREVPYYLICAHERTVGRQRLMQASQEKPIKARAFALPRPTPRDGEEP